MCVVPRQRLQKEYLRKMRRGTPKGVPLPLSSENMLSLLTIYHVQFQIFLQISIKILTTTFKVVILIL